MSLKCSNRLKAVLDLDATDDLIHGNQEGRFFHGYYGNYCYLPLYIFSGEYLLCGRLRRSNIDGAEGAVEELTRIADRLAGRQAVSRTVSAPHSGPPREWTMSTPTETTDLSDYSQLFAPLRQDVPPQVG